MGKFRNSNNVLCFKPDDGPDHFFMVSDGNSVPLSELFHLSRSKWGFDIDVGTLFIECMLIEVENLGYDFYVPENFTNFVKVSRIQQV